MGEHEDSPTTEPEPVLNLIDRSVMPPAQKEDFYMTVLVIQEEDEPSSNDLLTELGLRPLR